MYPEKDSSTQEQNCCETVAYHRDPVKELAQERTRLINRLAEIEKKLLWVDNSDVKRFLEEFPDVCL